MSIMQRSNNVSRSFSFSSGLI